MKILLVTEKHNPDDTERDGGAQLVKSLQVSFKDCLRIMQFSTKSCQLHNNWHYQYPVKLNNRFARRMANAEFIASQVNSIAFKFTHIIFVHIAMQFASQVPDNIATWTFPMFLTPSYLASGETVPFGYTIMERIALARTKNIITPSHFEKQQLLAYYHVLASKIYVIPRGVNTSLFKPIPRQVLANQTLNLCNIGSIKPQKNTLEVIDIFLKLQAKYPRSLLKIIGPVQNEQYFKRVLHKIKESGQSNNIKLTGYIPQAKLAPAIADCHIHLTAAHCETFGRAIFETLAVGMPNIAKLTNNAAHDFLQNLPYVKFIASTYEAVDNITKILAEFAKLSLMATEVGILYNDTRLIQLIVARITNNSTLIVSDYDGTLFHKSSHVKTAYYIKKFKQFRPRVICSARSYKDLLVAVKEYNLDVDWLISHSGAVITDSSGNIVFINPLSAQEIKQIIALVADYQQVIVNEQVIQIATSSIIDDNIFKLHLNIETYKHQDQRKSFIANWQSSKLQAICKLLDYLNWQGNVYALGDGAYDLGYLRYFDGERIYS